jgi:hypothetical protein
MLAESLGYRVRPRWLDGCGGGEVATAGERWIFIDDMQTVEEQTETVMRVLRADPLANLDGHRAA